VPVATWSLALILQQTIIKNRYIWALDMPQGESMHEAFRRTICADVKAQVGRTVSRRFSRRNEAIQTYARLSDDRTRT
jgi:hypothetical protein